MKKETNIKKLSRSFVYDRLYDQIGFTDQDLKLYQTKELTRLRHVSCSAVPTWTIPAGVCATKFEHSVGVAHLAKIVGKRSEFRDIAKDLYFSALAHDIGTPPFSHLSEYYQIQLIGKNHEVFAEEIIADGEFAREVKSQGGNIERIIAYVKGEEKPFSDLINGSMDIDNLDNSLRYGLSMGLLQKAQYSPEKLAKAYGVRDNRLVLLAEHASGIEGWEETRREVYEFVYREMNLSAGALVFRALDLAMREGEIGRDYFMLTDVEAFDYLATKCNVNTRTLVERANKWIFYQRVYNFRKADAGESLVSYILDSDHRGKLADEISSELHIPQEDVCVYLIKDKGFKKIHLPIVGAGIDREHQPKSNLAYMVQVYLHPKWTGKTKQVEGIVEEKLFTLESKRNK